jgi:hypothetical protein
VDRERKTDTAGDGARPDGKSGQPEVQSGGRFGTAQSCVCQVLQNTGSGRPPKRQRDMLVVSLHEKVLAVETF